MAEPPITQPQLPPPVASSPDTSEPAPAEARAAQSATVKLARLSSLTGILFAALFVLALVFIYTTPRLSASDAEITAYYQSGSTVLVTVGIYVVPFDGIDFLWHVHNTQRMIRSLTP